MAPPKPSVQTQCILSRMDEVSKISDKHWDQVMENLDLLFAKVGEIDRNQQKMDARVDISTKVTEQILKDQQLLAKQMELTGQAVSKLSLDQMEHQQKQPEIPTSFDVSVQP